MRGLEQHRDGLDEAAAGRRRNATACIASTDSIANGRAHGGSYSCTDGLVPQCKDLLTCGQMQFYEKGFDRATCRQDRPVPGTDKVFHNVTTTDDPNIRELAKGEANVFATDAIVAAPPQFQTSPDPACVAGQQALR